jgi:glycosyltransferase 2 family protein
MKTVLKILVSLGLIAAILWNHGGFQGLYEQIRHASIFYLVPVAALNLIDRGLMTYKWSLLLRGRGHKLPLLRGMMVYCASWVWGYFLPSTVGSDAIRAYCTARMGFDSREVVASIVVERFVGFLASMILMILSLILLTAMGILADKAVYVWLVGGALTLAGILVYFVSVSHSAFQLVHNRILKRFQRHRIANRLREFHETYHTFMKDRLYFGAFFWLTLLEQLFPILCMWLIARGMGIRSDLLYFAGALPLAMLFMRLPISLDGIGVFEVVFVLLMSLAGISASQSVAISITSRVIILIVMVPWWLAFVFVSGDHHVPVIPIEEKSGTEPVERRLLRGDQ